MGKRSLTAGLAAGGIMVGLFLLSHLLFMRNFDSSMWEIGEVIGYSSMIIALGAIFFGVKAYRDKVLGGKITFGKAFFMGIGISGVAAIVFGIYIYLLYAIISPDLSGRMAEIYKDKIKTSGQTEEIIRQQLNEFETQSAMWYSPFSMSLLMLFTVFLIGILISTVTAAILKRKGPLPIS